jgi:hypothetical protein
MFDKFKNEEGGEMVEERNADVEESVESSSVTESSSQIAMGELMAKRAKLEEGIDYVG